ncbi:MAG: hypothetical protein LWX52_16545 [Deltaproteobacteria bacterium]|nr:hypothetical protein [Deltaproteobacteria bacterium]
MRNRYVPFIFGLVALGLAAWLAFSFEGWWKYIVGGFLLAFGWVSLKTFFFATDQEIDELTTSTPMSKKTEERLNKRL